MESELWMSSGGTSSLLHSHADHDLHCVIAGRKDFILVQRQFKHVFHFVDRVRVYIRVSAAQTLTVLDLLFINSRTNVAVTLYLTVTERAAPLLICCHSFSPANHLLLVNHTSLI